MPLSHYALGVDRGLSFERASEMLRAKAEGNEAGALLEGEGFYISRSFKFGNGCKGVTLLLRERVSVFAASNWIPTFKIYRPNQGALPGTLALLAPPSTPPARA